MDPYEAASTTARRAVTTVSVGSLSYIRPAEGSPRRGVDQASAWPAQRKGDQASGRARRSGYPDRALGPGISAGGMATTTGSGLQEIQGTTGSASIPLGIRSLHAVGARASSLKRERFIPQAREVHPSPRL